MIDSRHRVGAVSAAALLAATGCAGRSIHDAADSADAFYDALAKDDGTAACAELSPATRSALVDSAGKPCQVAVLAEQVPQPGDLVERHVFGTAAQIRYAKDTIFLGRYAGGWQVTAASCTYRHHHPYDCLIEGG